MKKRWIILIFIVGVIILLFILAPFWVKNYINNNSEELIGRKLTMDRLYHNPLTGYTRAIDIVLFENEDTGRFITIDTLIVNLNAYKLIGNTFSLSELGIINPRVYVEQRDTVFNFSDLLETNPADTLSSQEEEGEGYSIDLNNIYMRNGELSYYDALLDRAWDFDDIDVSVPGVYLGNENTDVDLDLLFKDGGELISSIDYNHASKTFGIHLLLKQIDLSPASDYVKDYLNITGFGALLNADLMILGSSSHITETAIKGTAGVESLYLNGPGESQVLGMENFEVTIDEIIPIEGDIHISNIKATAPEITFQLINDSTTNLDQLVKPVASSEAESTSPSDSTSGEEMEFRIDEFLVENGKLNVMDLTPEQTFSYSFTDLTSKTINISPGDTTKAHLTAKAPKGGKITMDWNGDAFGLTYQSFTLSTNITDLPSFTPYTITFFDLPVENGHFNYTSTNHIQNNQLNGYHTILASDIEFGGKTGFKSLYDLPVKLGLYLLEDKNGDIRIEVPVTGDLNDPDYSYGKVIVKTLVQFLGKIITSPFRLFSGGEDDFNEIPYDAIYPSMVPDVASRLDVMIEALESKPKLKIDLVQVFDREEVANQLAIHQMKERYYKKTQRSAINDYFSIAAIDEADKEFQAYVAKETGKEIGNKKDLAPLCREYFSGDKFLLRLDTLSSSWNRIMTDYMVENGIPQENFEVMVNQEDTVELKEPKYLVNLEILESDSVSIE